MAERLDLNRGMFRNGEVVLNFYRKIAYRFDRKNKMHLKDYSRSRLGTFKDIQIYEEKRKELKKEVITFLEMGKRFSWEDQKRVHVDVELDQSQLIQIHRTAEYFKVHDYETLFSIVIREVMNLDLGELKTKKEMQRRKQKLKIERVGQELDYLALILEKAKKELNDERDMF